MITSHQDPTELIFADRRETSLSKINMNIQLSATAGGSRQMRTCYQGEYDSMVIISLEVTTYTMGLYLLCPNSCDTF